jgi:hypothetical protein
LALQLPIQHPYPLKSRGWLGVQYDIKLDGGFNFSLNYNTVVSVDYIYENIPFFPNNLDDGAHFPKRRLASHVKMCGFQSDI